MPEGDTLFRAAARLRQALEGHALTRFEAPRLRGRAPALDERITGVEARGKHLLIHFEGGLTLRTHLRMTGSWHLYRDRERWRKPAYLARAVVGADSGWVAVCFQAPVVETFDSPSGRSRPRWRRSAPTSACRRRSPTRCWTRSSLASRARAPAGTSLGEALLDQRIAAGIGNVYKSEACFAVGIDPATPIEADPARHPPRRVGGGGPAAAGQPRSSRAPHPPAGPGRLRTAGAALPSLRDPDPHGPPRRPQPEHLLVPQLPGSVSAQHRRAVLSGHRTRYLAPP